MADIFLSYAHEDEPSAKRIVEALEREGLDAWWDHEIPPGRSWDDVIGARIDASRVAVVIWSSKSVGSNFVKEEAQLALDAGKLLPVKVDECDPPVGFRRMQAANLADWHGEETNLQFRALVSEIRRRLSAAAGPAPLPHRSHTPAPPPPPARKLSPALLVVAGVVVVLGLIGVGTLFRGSSATTEEVAATDPAAAPATETTVAAPTPQTDARTIELQFWRSCCDDANATATDYRAYLSRYPSGEFAVIAEQRARTLETPRPAPAPTLYNTHWYGRFGTSGNFYMDFGSDGRISSRYETNSDSTYNESSSWTQSGTSIEFTLTGTDWYRGRIDGNVMTGDFGTPEAGRMGDFRMTRQ